MQEDKFRNTDTATWIGKHAPITVSVPSNLVEGPILLCNSNRGTLVESFVDVLDGLAFQSKTQMKLKFLDSETSVKNKFNQNLSAPDQRRCRK